MKTDSILSRTEKSLTPAIRLFLALLAFASFGLISLRAGTVYITADNLEGTNLFGTLDVATGQFTQIASTDPLFLALTTGPGGKIYMALMLTPAISLP